MDISGTFLSQVVLEKYFVQGLPKAENESNVRHELGQAYEEWLNNQGGLQPEPALHQTWLHFVLQEALEFAPETLLSGQAIPGTLSRALLQERETLRPDVVVQSPYEGGPRLLVQFYEKRQDLQKVVPERHWKASPATRMAELLRSTGVRLGLVTNGDQWMLVDAPRDETTGYYTWEAALWSEEPLTLRAFRALLGMERFFSVAENERLEALLAESREKQEEVTTQLGTQVRLAVGTLVRTLDRLDKDSQYALLREMGEKEIYEAALTVMMRLVFLLCAEEREMLLLGDELYDENYAISTMHKQLQEQADQQGEEVLGLRHDAWSRLLATFRLVYGGIEHLDLRLPAYGGHLFDPDRFPFLEGRAPGTSWLDTPAEPLLIDNRTVLHLLRALQFLQGGNGRREARRQSFRTLDIEQIGHVYEGLLDYTARRAQEPILGLVGSEKLPEPEVSLHELEEAQSKGQSQLLKLLTERTGRSESALAKDLVRKLDGRDLDRVSSTSGAILAPRVLPFVGLLRRDTFGDFLVIPAGSLHTAPGGERRNTGTHYTPRSLTEPLVQHALDPLVYYGPAEGLPPEQWRLHEANELLNLKICDLAMGSGAFLVQVCRYLSEKLVEAWDTIVQSDTAEAATQRLPRIAPVGQPSQGRPGEELLSRDQDERLATARRLIAERCLYGVDKNPMAVEMAKLSLWLITLAKNKPFTFLDSNLRSGDSLLGVDLMQLKRFSLEESAAEKSGQLNLMEEPMRQALNFALPRRHAISMTLEKTVRDVAEKERKLHEVNAALELLKLGADLLIAQALYKKDPPAYKAIWNHLYAPYMQLLQSTRHVRENNFTTADHQASRAAYKTLRAKVNTLLVAEADKLSAVELGQYLSDNGGPELLAKIAGLAQTRTPFHWPLEFPEVFADGGEEAGFAAMVGNPPFQGGQKITGVLGTDYRDYLVEYLAQRKHGSADLCSYFFLNVARLVRKGGMSALLATNTVAQGDTREVGLDQIVAKGWSIPRAVPSRKWPGAANLEVAHVWMRHGMWQGPFVLDEQKTEGITPLLTKPGQTRGNPYPLVVNSGKSFIGSYVLGLGFVLEPEEAQALITKDPCNKDVLFPYLNGQDLNSRYDQSPSRWVINFFDWPLEKAEQHIDCMKVVREKVKPERDCNNRQVRRERWWQFAERAPALYSTIADMERALVIAQTSRTLAFTFASTNEVFSHMIVVFASDEFSSLGLLQSSFHLNWVTTYASSMKGDQRYIPSDCFETFPFPPAANLPALDSIGKQYYTHRQSIMLTRHEGLTATYNRFHNPNEHAPDIARLRELHREMDEAVARVYGWQDLMLGHNFYETKQGLRWTISEEARREVLDRLLLLNHQRHAEEVAAGLVDASGKPLKTKKAGKAKATVVEDNDEFEPAEVQPPEQGPQQGQLF
jgi:hypothetical protein